VEDPQRREQAGLQPSRGTSGNLRPHEHPGRQPNEHSHTGYARLIAQHICCTDDCATDSARQFLSASSPGDKYKLFLRGTQLQQLSEEYETCRQNISTTYKLLEKKKAALPDLREAYNSAQSKWKDAQAAREQRNKVDTLKREIAWAHVNEKGLELEAKLVVVQKLERQIPQAEEKLAASKAKYAEIEEEVVQAGKAVEDYGTAEEVEARRRSVVEELNELKVNLKTLQTERRGMNEDFKRLDGLIAQYDADIQRETRKLADREAGRQEELRARLEEAHQRYKESEQATIAAHAKVTEQEEAVQRINHAGAAVGREIDDARRDMDQCQTQLNQARTAVNNEFAAYGSGMKNALGAIAAARWQGETPIGPFGRYVKVRDPKWTDLVRGVLGPRMMMFVVTDARDRNALKRILDQNNLRLSCRTVIVTPHAHAPHAATLVLSSRRVTTSISVQASPLST
jgi:chromosome segregation ATPase